MYTKIDIVFRRRPICSGVSVLLSIANISLHLSRSIGSSIVTFSLKTRALAASVSCARMTIALSVFRRGSANRLLSITSYFVRVSSLHE